jgi:hypothetical protein
MSFFSELSSFQKTKWIYIGVYFVLNLAVLFISFQLSLDNVRALINLSRMVPYMRYFATAAMLMFLGLLLIHYLEVLSLKRDMAKRDQDMHLLKSKLYDLEKGTQGKEEIQTRQESK